MKVGVANTELLHSCRTPILLNLFISFLRVTLLIFATGNLQLFSMSLSMSDISNANTKKVTILSAGMLARSKTIENKEKKNG